MKRLFAMLLVAVMLAGLLPVSAVAAPKYATVVGGWLRLRAAASFNAETITSYYTGTQVQILGSTGSWYKVYTPDGRTGYMYGQYLSFNTAAAPDAGSGKAVITSSNGYGVRLRQGPGTGYRIIRVYDVGTVVNVLQRGTNWSRISINGTVGYMMNQFLIFGGSSMPSGGTVVGTATIWSRNGYGVRLRTGPSKGYDIIGVYSVGTSVGILEYGSTWCKIQVGSRVGYMMTEFLRITQSKEVTAVKLNTTNPVMGDILTVTSITPSGAKVDYAWLVDGVVVGTDKELWLNDAAFDGKVITLRVTGTNGYNGTAVVSTQPVLSARVPLTTLELNNDTPAVGDTLKIKTIEPADATYTCAWYADGKKISSNATLKLTIAHAGKTIELRVTGNGVYEGELAVATAPVMKKADAPSLTSVEIVNTSAEGATPNVGHTLSASVTPDTTQVSYKWYKVAADGTLTQIGTKKTLRLTAAHADHEIIVRATGTGAYKTGNPYDVEASAGTVTALSRIKSITLSPLTSLTFKKGSGTTADSGTTLSVKVAANVTVKDPAATFNYAWKVNGAIVGTEPSYTVTEADVGYTVTVEVSPIDLSVWTDETFTQTTTEVVKAPLVTVQTSPTGTVDVGDTVSVITLPAAAIDNAIVNWYVNGVLRSTGSTFTVEPGDARSDRQCTLKAEIIAASPYTGTKTYSVRINPYSASTLTLSTDIIGEDGVIIGTSSEPVQPPVTEGDGNVPEGDGNVPEGDGNVPEGDGNSPEGDGNVPEGDGNVPEGDGNVPEGDGNVPEGDGNVPEGDGNVPEGDGNVPEGDGNVPEGDGNVPEGDGNVPEGDGNVPEGDGNVPEGDGNVPEGDGNVPEGDGNVPEGDGNVPEGDGNAPEGDEELPAPPAPSYTATLVQYDGYLQVVLTPDNGNVVWRWYRDGIEVLGAMLSTYTLSEADNGCTFTAAAVIDGVEQAVSYPLVAAYTFEEPTGEEPFDMEIGEEFTPYEPGEFEEFDYLP